MKNKYLNRKINKWPKITIDVFKNIKDYEVENGEHMFYLFWRLDVNLAWHVS